MLSDERIEDGGPAFPVNTESSQNEGACYADPGMTLRDYFAAKAMQGLLAQSQGMALGSKVDAGAEYAYAMADAMLAARNKSTLRRAC